MEKRNIITGAVGLLLVCTSVAGLIGWGASRHQIDKMSAQMDEMQRQMTALMRDVTLSEIKHTTRITTDYKPTEAMEVPAWIA